MKKTCEKCYYGGNGCNKKHVMVMCKKRGTKVRCSKQRNNCKDFRTSPPDDRPHLSYADMLRMGW